MTSQSEAERDKAVVDAFYQAGMDTDLLCYAMADGKRSTPMASDVPQRSANDFRRAPARPCRFPAPTVFAPSEQVPPR
jgi:hypothetical protein